MLALTDKECLIAHVSQHGEYKSDLVELVVDIKITMQGSPALIDMIVPGFSEHFFKEANSSGQMAGPLQKRFPAFEEPYKFDTKIPGYRVAFVQQVSGMAAFSNEKATLTKVSVELVDGGAVTLTFMLQCHGDIDAMITAYPLMGKKLPITLTPPAAEPLPAEHPDNSKRKGKKAAAAQEPEKLIEPDANEAGGVKGNGAQPEPPAVDPMKGTDLEAKNALDKAAARGSAAKGAAK